MLLLDHIKSKNARSRKEMAKTPGLFIGIITEDLDHWAKYDIYTVEQYEFYMDSMGLEDWLAEITSKSYARMRLRECKTTADLDAVEKEFA